MWVVAARARDAAGDAPVCGDEFAARFVPERPSPLVEDLLALERPTASVVVRHALIDGILREALAAKPERAVLLLGAGYDSRAFRLGAGRFVEVDRDEVLAAKEAALPAASAPRPLTRVSLELPRERLPDALVESLGEDPLIVAEGLLMYLEREAIDVLFGTLREQFPRHSLIADLLSQRFVEQYAPQLEAVLARHGLRFVTRPTDIHAEFLTRGYASVETHSVIGANPAVHMPFFVRWFKRELFRGNLVCVASAS